MRAPLLMMCKFSSPGRTSIGPCPFSSPLHGPYFHDYGVSFLFSLCSPYSIANSASSVCFRFVSVFRLLHLIHYTSPWPLFLGHDDLSSNAIPPRYVVVRGPVQGSWPGLARHTQHRVRVLSLIIGCKWSRMARNPGHSSSLSFRNQYRMCIV